MKAVTSWGRTRLWYKGKGCVCELRGFDAQSIQWAALGWTPEVDAEVRN